jgi:sensor histidine kinase YesM
VVGRYPVISLARAMPYLDVLLYMESGYKLLDITPSESLRAMGAVILAAADSGEYMYASDEAFLQTAGFSKTGGAGEGAGYRTYRYTDTRGWSLCAYIPQSAFRREAFRLSFGFFIIALTALVLSVFLSALIWRSVRRPLALFEKNLKHLILDEDDSGLYSVRLREFDQYVEHFVMLKKRIVELLEEARQQERARSSLELKLLMHKINPHFIYNTLNTLKWYSAAHGYPDMDGFISSLNRLLVYNMEKTGEATLQSELDSIDDYICLQKLKYDIAYTRKILVPDSMRGSRTPRFILYPLVENAILHGLQGNGAVEVCASLAEDGGIAVRVFDSGGSLDEGEITRILEQARDSSGRGIGLRYVCQTLETMFPGESSVSIRREDGGTVCEIRMPYCVGAVYAKNNGH